MNSSRVDGSGWVGTSFEVGAWVGVVGEEGKVGEMGEEEGGEEEGRGSTDEDADARMRRISGKISRVRIGGEDAGTGGGEDDAGGVGGGGDVVAMPVVGRQSISMAEDAEAEIDVEGVGGSQGCRCWLGRVEPQAEADVGVGGKVTAAGPGDQE